MHAFVHIFREACRLKLPPSSSRNLFSERAQVPEGTITSEPRSQNGQFSCFNGFSSSPWTGFSDVVDGCRRRHVGVGWHGGGALGGSVSRRSSARLGCGVRSSRRRRPSQFGKGLRRRLCVGSGAVFRMCCRTATAANGGAVRQRALACKFFGAHSSGTSDGVPLLGRRPPRTRPNWRQGLQRERLHDHSRAFSPVVVNSSIRCDRSLPPKFESWISV